MIPVTFQIGDLVYINSKQPSCLEHFTKDCLAIIIGVRECQGWEYKVFMQDKGEHGGYEDGSFTFIKHDQKDLIGKWQADMIKNRFKKIEPMIAFYKKGRKRIISINRPTIINIDGGDNISIDEQLKKPAKIDDKTSMIFDENTKSRIKKYRLF